MHISPCRGLIITPILWSVMPPPAGSLSGNPSVSPSPFQAQSKPNWPLQCWLKTSYFPLISALIAYINMTSLFHYKTSIWPLPLTYPEKKHCKHWTYKGINQQKWKSSPTCRSKPTYAFLFVFKISSGFVVSNGRKKDMLIRISTAQLFIWCNNVHKN